MKADLPGLMKDNIHVDFKDNRITISTERSGEVKEKDESFRRIEVVVLLLYSSLQII